MWTTKYLVGIGCNEKKNQSYYQAAECELANRFDVFEFGDFSRIYAEFKT